MIKSIRYALAAVSILGLASLALAQTVATTSPATELVPTTRQLFKPEELNINPEGGFLTHGMIVQSVSGNSFVGKVWGTSWTVNIANVSELKFLLQNGTGTGQTALSSVMKPGDEVGVSGWVDVSHELTVNGQVVRDYSLGDTQELKDREMEMENEHENNNENSGNSENNQDNQNQGESEVERGRANNSESSSDNQQTIQLIQQQIQNILEQLKQMQGKQ